MYFDSLLIIVEIKQVKSLLQFQKDAKVMVFATFYEITTNKLLNHYVVCCSGYERKRKAFVFFSNILQQSHCCAFTFYVVLQVDFKCDVVLNTEPVTPYVVSLL